MNREVWRRNPEELAYVALDESLGAIVEAARNEDEKKLQIVLKENGPIILNNLPFIVTDLVLGYGERVMRNPSQKQRKTWNLGRVDAYVQDLSQKVGREYTPKFSSSKQQ